MQQILKSQLNFRDLGGIVTGNGRKVRTGLLFRSGELYSLSGDDIHYLETIGLSLIIDLRAEREIAARPDKTIATVREILPIHIYDAARDTAEHYLAKNDAAGMERVLIGDYRRLVTRHQEDFRHFLKILATTANLPAVFHCAAGKDRTGLATVFLLTALGVNVDIIRQDYLVTNDYTLPNTNRIIRKVTESGVNGEILRPLLEVREEYLNAALDEIDLHFGGLQDFVFKTLGADMEGLQEKYLE